MGVTTNRDDPGLKKVDPVTKMQEVYLVLPEEDRLRGFVNPYYDTYFHIPCQSKTKMGKALSETYARNPHFYGATYCCVCMDHYPVGVNGEFVWVDKNNALTDLKVGATPEEMRVWNEAVEANEAKRGDGERGLDADPEAESSAEVHEGQQGEVDAPSPSSTRRTRQRSVHEVQPEVPETP